MQAVDFRDRREAGARLAARLAQRHDLTGAIVYGLARGGVPVAAEVAAALDVPLEALIVRKLGAPGQPELAIGALAPDGVRVLNDALVRLLAISDRDIAAIALAEARELERREREYRSGRPAADPVRRTAILIDDGLATGASMEAAVAWARARHAARVMVAVPVAADSAVERLEREADEVIAILVPPVFEAVGAWYEDFSQTSDEEVLARLAEADRRRRTKTPS
jgi:predicted phosphoribosyltransferase